MKDKNEELKYNNSVTTNKKGEAILGQLYGTVADVVNPTRNGRKYDDALWEKVFEDPIVNEYFEAGGLLGELNHPADREETDLTQVAVCMPEKPVKNKDGQLVATLDILDTPNGRIVATLAKYGYKLGISSRGSGDLYTDIDGTEHVDESTYKLEAWDIVLLPAVKSARLKMVESLQNGKTFKQAINEELDRATADEKAIMQETLNKLNLEYKSEKIVDKQNIAANDDGARIVKELQESLLAKEKAEAQVIELQEKLSVCYAKEAKYEEDIGKYKTTIRNLSESASKVKALQTKIENLNEELNQKDLAIKSEQDKFNVMLKKQRAGIERQSSLTESISEKTNQLKEKDLRLKRLQEQFNVSKQESEQKINSLNESLAEIKKNLTIKTTEYNNKLSNANKLIEQYRATAKTAVNKYIDSQALRLGINSNEIKNKLPENYSFNDIDSICESLSKFNLAVSNLPLSLQKGATKIKIKESTEPLLKPLSDDTIDDSLIRMANWNY